MTQRSYFLPTLLTVAAVLVTLSLSVQPARSLPSFAEAYGVNCSMCHSVPPQLNSYGRYVQRTGYAALDRQTLKNTIPLNVVEEPSYDTRSSTGRIEAGNTALHAAGYLAPEVTFHIHQWFVQNGMPGGLDTMQFAYSGLLHGNGHLFAGKLSALPVPGPFSNGSDLAGFAAAGLQIGEHMYQADMMRWGTSFSYVRPTFFVQAAWLGSNADLNGATDFSPNNDKTVEWIAAYANPSRPFEIGLYGSVGSFPLAEGGIDRYHTIAAYVQRDPGRHYVPGFFASYQWGYDGNPGSTSSPTGMSVARRTRGVGDTGTGMTPAARSRAMILEAYQPLFDSRLILGLRHELTDDGMGAIGHSGNIDLAITPFARYQYLHLYFESALQQGNGPAWRGMFSWSPPLGSILPQRNAAAQQVAAGPGGTSVGQSIYATKCGACHGASGQGLSGTFPALAGNLDVKAGDPKGIIATVKRGKSAMPSFGAQLSNADIAAVLTYLRTTWGNNASSVTEADVASTQ